MKATIHPSDRVMQAWRETCDLIINTVEDRGWDLCDGPPPFPMRSMMVLGDPVIEPILPELMESVGRRAIEDAMAVAARPDNWRDVWALVREQHFAYSLVRLGLCDAKTQASWERKLKYAKSKPTPCLATYDPFAMENY